MPSATTLDRAQGAVGRGPGPRPLRAPDRGQAGPRRAGSSAWSGPASPACRPSAICRSIRRRGSSALLRRCVSAGWVSFPARDRPVVVLTEEGRAVMKGERPARLLLPPPGRRADAAPAAARPARARAAPARRARPRSWTPAAQALFEALRRHRLAVARAEGLAPFIVASDRTLRDIAALRPRTLDELRDGPRHRAAQGRALRAGLPRAWWRQRPRRGSRRVSAQAAAARGGRARGHRQEVRRTSSRCATSRCRSRPASSSASWARAAAARPRCCGSSPGSSGRTRAW